MVRLLCTSLRVLVAGVLACVAGIAAAQSQLNVICSVQAEWCNLAAVEFEKETGIKIDDDAQRVGRIDGAARRREGEPEARRVVRRHRRSALAGGRARTDRGVQLADDRAAAAVGAKAGRASEISTVGIYLGVLGLGYNTELLAKKKVPAPACWKDLAKAEYANDVQMANPNASGTAYTAIATLVQLFGEEEAFKILKALHKNITNYARQGVGPIKATARGENIVAVAFIHDVVTEAQAGFPVKSVAPCEGTGYEIGSMSIVKGARNLDNAKKFVRLGAHARRRRRWARRPSSSSCRPTWRRRFRRCRRNRPRSSSSTTTSRSTAPSAERKRLLERWDREVGSQPR